VIDVYRLAGELGVSAEVIRRAAAELGGPVPPDAALSEELADRVRAELRTARSRSTGPAGSAIFSAGRPQPAAPAPRGGTIAAAFPGSDTAERPERRVDSPDRPRETDSVRPANGDQLRPADPSAPEPQDPTAAQLAGPDAATLAAQWRAAGLGPHDRHIIEQCQRHGLAPQDVARRVDGQTIASRLKNGESISSVRSRLPQPD
jgi:hypothetical protein